MTRDIQGVPSKDTVVGWAIEVYWPQEQDWFTGEIVDYHDGKFKVLYDDGDVIWEEEDSSMIRYLNKNTLDALPPSEDENTICLSPKATYAPCDFDEDDEEEDDEHEHEHEHEHGENEVLILENENPHVGRSEMIASLSDDEDDDTRPEQLHVSKDEEEEAYIDASSVMMIAPEDEEEDDMSEVGSVLELQNPLAPEALVHEEKETAGAVRSKWDSPVNAHDTLALLPIVPSVEDNFDKAKAEAEEQKPSIPEDVLSVHSVQERRSTRVPRRTPDRGRKTPVLQEEVEQQWRIGQGHGQLYGQIIAASHLPLLSEDSDAFVTVSLVAASASSSRKTHKPSSTRSTLFRRKTTVYMYTIDRSKCLSSMKKWEPIDYRYGTIQKGFTKVSIYHAPRQP